MSELEGWVSIMGLVLCDVFFGLVRDRLAGFVSHCDEEVVHCVGYILGVGVCFAFVRECCG